MKVSVVVPVRDGGRYLGETLESVLAQRRAPDEVIVVDDGSADDSARIAGSFPGVTVVRRPPMGPAAARNAGARRASGGALAFQDADDLCDPCHLERLVPALEDDPAAVLAVGRVRHFLSPDREAELTGRYAVPEGDSFAFLPGSMLIRRSAFLATGGFDEELPGGEVVDWIRRRRAADAPMVRVDAVVHRRRIHGGNLTLRRAALHTGYLAVARAAVEQRRRSAG